MTIIKDIEITEEGLFIITDSAEPWQISDNEGNFINNYKRLLNDCENVTDWVAHPDGLSICYIHNGEEIQREFQHN